MGENPILETSLQQKSGIKLDRRTKAKITKWFSITIKVFILGIMLAVAGVMIWLFTKPEYLHILLVWIQHQGYYGNLLVIVAYIGVSLPVALAGYTFVTLASGFLYRILEGEITSFIGANILGAAFSYWACSTLGKSWVESHVQGHRKLRAVLHVVRQHGFKIAFLFRFTPVPYGLQNAVFAISGLSFKSFMLATLGLVPEQIMWVYFGSTAREITDVFDHHTHFGKGKIILIVIELVAVILVSILIIIYARRSLRNTIGDDEEAKKSLLRDDSQDDLDHTMSLPRVASSQDVNGESYSITNYV